MGRKQGRGGGEEGERRRGGREGGGAQGEEVAGREDGEEGRKREEGKKREGEKKGRQGGGEARKGLRADNHRGILMHFLARSDRAGRDGVMKTDDPRPALPAPCGEESHNLGWGGWEGLAKRLPCPVLWHLSSLSAPASGC